MLRHLLVAAAVLAVAGTGAVAGFGLETRAAEPAAGGVSDCPDRLERGTPSLVCRCGSGNMGGGTIWGTDAYTDDSPICRAAVHAGVIGPGGGIVEVSEAPGRASYQASERNGVSSGSWASYPCSIVFTGGRAPGMQACPDRLASDTPSLTCSCASDAIGDGTIWGSGFYTADSPICRAAVHAGAIGPRGGVVTVRAAPGRSSYPSATRNGISSSSWASYDRSITFESAGDDDK